MQTIGWEIEGKKVLLKILIIQQLVGIANVFTFILFLQTHYNVGAIF